jgi:alpha-beta hydrolase superfamily lysophospholipase
MKQRRYIKGVLWFLLVVFILLNGIAYMHAYRFTHFIDKPIQKTSEQLSSTDKLKLLFTGVSNPKPKAKEVPKQPYEVITIQSNKRLECWLLRAKEPKGTVALFHGYGGQKASILDKAEAFLQMGYNTLLVDFMGSGGSEGVQTTIGYKEAQEVKDCFKYLKQQGYANIHLFGTSMGAVAIMRAMAEYKLQPTSLILECPFGTMYQTVEARFKMFQVPAFPMAGLLMFWGGVQNGFWAFSHNPVDYAKAIKCPTLLLYGLKDPKVSKEEIEAIYANIEAKKQLVFFPLAGHENYLLKYKQEWITTIKPFLQLHYRSS